MHTESNKIISYSINKGIHFIYSVFNNIIIVE